MSIRLGWYWKLEYGLPRRIWEVLVKDGHARSRDTMLKGTSYECDDGEEQGAAVKAKLLDILEAGFFFPPPATFRNLHVFSKPQPDLFSMSSIIAAEPQIHRSAGIY